jgi:ATP-binding cassette subfamily B protein
MMKQSLKNNIFMLKLLGTAAPMFLTLNILSGLLNTLILTLQLAYFKLIMDMTISAADRFLFIVTIIVVYTILRSIITAFYILVNSKYNAVAGVKVQEHIQMLLFKKLREMDLAGYDTEEYYDQYIRAVGEADGRALMVASTFIEMCTNAIGVISVSIFVGFVSPLFLLFVAGSVINSVVMIFRQNKYIYNNQIESTASHRKREYIKRVFYLRDYAQGRVEKRILTTCETAQSMV